jgi:hypothetical protein
MLEPLHQAGQWAWQQAASKATMATMAGGNPPGWGGTVPLNLPDGFWPQSSNDRSHPKGFLPLLPEKAVGLTLWRRGRQKLQQLSEKLRRALGHPKPDRRPIAPSPRFRPREQILKDFPYNEVGKLPRFTLRPDEISVNPAAERLHQLEAIQVFNAPWDSEHLFNPFLEH